MLTEAQIKDSIESKKDVFKMSFKLFMKSKKTGEDVAKLLFLSNEMIRFENSPSIEDFSEIIKEETGEDFEIPVDGKFSKV